MGDRTNVTLIVLTSQAAEAQQFFNEDIEEESNEETGLTAFMFEEVNYGELRFLPKLIEHGIAYNSEWEKGEEYDDGFESCRFTPIGEVETKEVYYNDRNPDINDLMGMLDNPLAIRKYLLNHHERITTLPWDRQEEYGKLYRTRKLILPVAA